MLAILACWVSYDSPQHPVGSQHRGVCTQVCVSGVSVPSVYTLSLVCLCNDSAVTHHSPKVQPARRSLGHD